MRSKLAIQCLRNAIAREALPIPSAVRRGLRPNNVAIAVMSSGGEDGIVLKIAGTMEKIAAFKSDA